MAIRCPVEFTSLGCWWGNALIEKCQAEIDIMGEIEELMRANGIRRTKKALRTLVPIGLEAGIAVLGLEELISPMQSIIANAAVGLSAQFFCTEKETQVAEDKAYLFYARQNGMIMPSRRAVKLI